MFKAPKGFKNDVFVVGGDRTGGGAGSNVFTGNTKYISQSFVSGGGAPTSTCRMTGAWRDGQIELDLCYDSVGS